VTDPLMVAEHLVKHFPVSRSLAQSIRGRPSEVIHAVDDVSFSIQEGEALGLIGESGSGKTTLGWLLARLHEPTSGAIRFGGTDILRLRGAELRRWRRNLQLVFQDPVGSLDPRMRVWQIVGEPLEAQRRGENGARRSRFRREEIRREVAAVLPTVGLPTDCLDHYPHQFSGGGRQRLSLARALILGPRLLILDEPTSALDVAVQAQILNRLVTLQKERNLAYLLITHNVAAVRYVADRVAVMYLGELVEVGPVRPVLEQPMHPYTKALLAAVPVADVRRRRARYRIGGEIPTLIHPPPGCRFAARCPFVIPRCRTEAPPLRQVGVHWVSCHRAEEVADVAPESLLSSEPTPAETAAAPVS
jgi:oligopeptide/dipeptide ABC transporter ATP-binding protein